MRVLVAVLLLTLNVIAGMILTEISGLKGAMVTLSTKVDTINGRLYGAEGEILVLKNTQSLKGPALT